MASETDCPDTGLPAETRRNVLKGSVAGLAAGLLATSHPALGQDPAARHAPDIAIPAFDSTHEPKALPFRSSSLKGLSKGLIESHWSNNYGGSVRALNETNRRLTAALADPNLPAFVYNDLKREHLVRSGSVVLHELYFDNLGGDGNPSANLRGLIGRAFGSYDRWETEYRRVAAGLGGGSGWVVLGYNRHFGALENYWMADHMHFPAATEPLLVIDMYEHSYHMDYGAATARYVDAFFANIRWDVVSARAKTL
ncbi:MAG: Fe-Mn family superoxide dismutase [Gammaproteobacteria bacterium]|nr:Fe-Mn family superoxide dismutase [Gammaproteobacteria bacterium]